MNPVFDDFQAACDWVDDHTSPENAGAFVIEQTAPQRWQVVAMADTHNNPKGCITTFPAQCQPLKMAFRLPETTQKS